MFAQKNKEKKDNKMKFHYALFVLTQMGNPPGLRKKAKPKTNAPLFLAGQRTRTVCKFVNTFYLRNDRLKRSLRVISDL